MNIPIYGNQNGKDPNLFQIWLGWLRDLGGRYEPMRDLSEPKPRTGRRDSDRKPRKYELGTHQPDRQYAITTKGTIVRL